jgi:hypothetical protein
MYCNDRFKESKQIEYPEFEYIMRLCVSTLNFGSKLDILLDDFESAPKTMNEPTITDLMTYLLLRYNNASSNSRTSDTNSLQNRVVMRLLDAQLQQPSLHPYKNLSRKKLIIDMCHMYASHLVLIPDFKPV